MKVFLSWSGDRSKMLADIFKEWLPNVLQYVDPYMSANDIELGERWSANIEENLRKHDFGLVFVTPENINAPWINFEAGALSKNLKSRLVPMLYEADVTILNTGPLKQFQSQKNFEEDSIRELIKNINSNIEENYSLSNERLDASFDKWWPDLKEKIDNIPPMKSTEKSEAANEDFEKDAIKLILNKLENMERKERNRTAHRDIRQLPKLLVEDLSEAYETIESTNRFIDSELKIYEKELIELNSEVLEALQLQREASQKIEKATTYLRKRYFINR